MTDPDLLGSHLMKGQGTEPQSHSASITLSHAIDIYIRHKGQGKTKNFHTSVQRAFRYLTDTNQAHGGFSVTVAVAILGVGGLVGTIVLGAFFAWLFMPSQ